MLLFENATLPRPAIDISVENWNVSQVHFAGLNVKEKEFYYWVNYSRANPSRFFDRVVRPVALLYPQLAGPNLESLRRDLANKGPVPLLKLNPDLMKMARTHATDIVSHRAKPSHNSTNGESFADRFRKQNLKGCGAENLSFGAGEPIFLVVLLYLDINIPDLGHRKTLLNEKYVETGIGAQWFEDGTIFIVEDFSCPQK